MSEVTVTNCDNEQIHIPGCIQTFGILICVDFPDFEISQISENVEEILGRQALSFLGRSLKSIISLKEFESFRDQIISTESSPGPFKKSFHLKKNDGTTDLYMGFIHHHDKNIIIELEKHSTDHVEHFFQCAEKALSEIQAAPSLQILCEVATREVQKLTGYDRVMLYKFDPIWNGEVVAESRSGKGLDTFLGHRFPGSDIPPQARAVFLSNWVRTIPDVDYTPVPIIPTLHPKTQTPLNLGQSFLRAVSPIHIHYLKNMKVRSTLTISLIKDGQLWGLIACHHATSKLTAYDIRSTCQFIGKLISSQLGFQETIADNKRSKKLQTLIGSLMHSMNCEEELVKGLVNYTPNVLELSGSKSVSVALRMEGEWTLIGKTPEVEQLDQLADWLTMELKSRDKPVFVTDRLPSLYPQSNEYPEIASGILAISIPKTDRSFIIWFKPEVVQTVIWAGNPKKNIETLSDGSLKIEPRSSFESWKETVRLRSNAWLPAEINAALDLRSAIVNIDLRRQFVREQKARAEAERTSREKGDVLATVSHDLKNPLFSIDLIMQWFEKKYRNQNTSDLDAGKIRFEIDSVFSKIKISTRRMQRLIEDLLDVAKIEGGTFSLVLRPSEVHNFVMEAVNLLQTHASLKGISLSCICPSPTVRLLDEDRIMQVMSNLLGNAIKFTPSKGKISILVETRPHELRISVHDTGAGISVDHLPHVFDRFWQAQATSKMGSGLGLAICRGIVEACGGKIWIESKLGVGTSVSFTLPDRSDPQKSNVSASRHPFKSPIAPMKILLVEDDNSIRGTLRELLVMEGHHCKEAVDGLEAKEILENDPNYDLIITDLRMPRWDGTRLLEWCRVQKLSLPVIFISANVELLEREKKALEDSCAAIMRKPVSLAGLLKEIGLARIRLTDQV